MEVTPPLLPHGHATTRYSFIVVLVEVPLSGLPGSCCSQPAIAGRPVAVGWPGGGGRHGAGKAGDWSAADRAVGDGVWTSAGMEESTVETAMDGDGSGGGRR